MSSRTSSRATKRKAGKDKDEAASRRKKQAQPVSANLPFTRDGVRYINGEFVGDENSTDRWCRYSILGPVTLAPYDRAAQLSLDDASTTVTGFKGYCSVRASHGVPYDTWYYEAEVLPSESTVEGAEPHVRLGWSQPEADVQLPCGFDCFSYSWRDVDGSKVHMSKRQPYSGSGFGPGDVLGLEIHLPKCRQTKFTQPMKNDSQVAIFKGRPYFVDETRDRSKIEPIKGSYIRCYKNGIDQGIMFTDLLEGVYFPTISVYYGAAVKANFGPDFKHPCPNANARPMCDAEHLQTADAVLSIMVWQLCKDEEPKPQGHK